MKQYITLAAAACMAASSGMAQNVVDAVRYGNSEIIGTARYRAMGGAFGALGGDPTCMSDNPAGIAIYRGTSVFSFTPHLIHTNIAADGTEITESSKNSFGVSNFAWIGSFRAPSYESLVNFNIGLSVDRRHESHQEYDLVIDGDMPKFAKGSFGEYLTNQANNYLSNSLDPYDAFDWENNSTQAPYLSMLAWNCFAIDEDKNNTHRVIDPMADFTPYQRLYTREDTHMENINLSMAANFNDVFYLGATLNFMDLHSTMMTEMDEDYDFNYEGSYIAYDNKFETTSTGTSLKLGMLWAPVDGLRLGAAIHTPFYSTVHEMYEGSMCTDDERCEDWENFYDDWYFELRTPWEYQLSAAYIIGNKGLISVEYDARDYSSMKYAPSRQYSMPKSYFKDANNKLSDCLQTQQTFKVGAEYRISKAVSARAGYALTTSPYTDDAYNATINPNDHGIVYSSYTKPNFQTLGDQSYLSFGAGWRGKNWTLDAAYVYHHQDQKTAAYPGDFSTCVMNDLDINKHSFDLTVSYRF